MDSPEDDLVDESGNSEQALNVPLMFPMMSLLPKHAEGLLLVVLGLVFWGLQPMAGLEAPGAMADQGSAVGAQPLATGSTASEAANLDPVVIANDSGAKVDEPGQWTMPADEPTRGENDPFQGEPPSEPGQPDLEQEVDDDFAVLSTLVGVELVEASTARMARPSDFVEPRVPEPPEHPPRV